jgi:hypothetical protein
MLKELGYVAPDEEEQLPEHPSQDAGASQERLFGAAKQQHLEMQQHPNEHNVAAVCMALVCLADAFLAVCVGMN